MQKPAAFVDHVIFKRSLGDLAARYPRSVWRRDTLQTRLSVESQEVFAARWMIQVCVAGKMTPCLQLTDTDCAYLFKVEASRIKEELLLDF